MTDGTAAAPTAPGKARRWPVYLAVFMIAVVALAAIGSKRAGGDLAALLPGPDDKMRIVQVIDWLDGQGWADTTQRRLNPPEGIVMHWSRLPDLPLAAVVVVAEPALGRRGAVTLAALLVPVIWGGLFCVAFVWAALPLAAGGRALVPILMLGSLVIPLQQLLPGRVDHHGLQLLLTMLGLGLLVRALLPPGMAASIGLGIAGAVSLSIGLEALPFLGAATAVLVLAWVWRGDPAAAPLIGFGAALMVATGVMILLTLPVGRWALAACDQMSVAHLALTAVVPALGAVAWGLGRAVPDASPLRRFVTGGAFGIAGLVLVGLAFPHCAGSPYAGLSQEARFWFDSVSEAQTLVAFFERKPGAAVAFGILPLAAVATTAWHVTRRQSRTGPMALGLFVLTLSGAALVSWQIRGVNYAALTAALGLVPLALWVDARADGARSLLSRVGLRVVVPLGAALAVLTPYMVTSKEARDPVAEHRKGCPVAKVIPALNDEQTLGTAPLVIAGPVDFGPDILLATRHAVLAAPHHRNIRGLADNRRIFAGSEAEAVAMIKARQVGAVIFCARHAALFPYPGTPAFLIERIAAGTPPAWLAPVATADGIALYRVRGEALGTP